MGVAFQGDVKNTVAQARSASDTDAQLLKQYPDLADDKSEFFQVTAEIYNDLARDPHMKKSPRLSALAAELADKRLNGAEPVRRSRRAVEPEDDDDDDLDPEEQRISRVRRQASSSGRRSTRSADSGGEELDAMQKTIVAKLRAAGADITEDGYRKRAQAGVRMSGIPTRRRAA